MKRLTVALAGLIALVLVGCNGDTASPTTTSDDTGPPFTLIYDFENGSDGWARDVSDYSEATRPEDVLTETEVAPPGFDEEGGFIHLAASNRSDDLFLYMMRQIGAEVDLQPNTAYQVDFRVAAASNAPSNCAGIGGAPGESVWLKVGASTQQPIPVTDDGQTRLAVDKGGQSQGGENADVAGVIANGIPCEQALENNEPYAMLTWEESLDSEIETNDQAELWVFVGTDSGFEGRTDLYYDTVEVTLSPAG